MREPRNGCILILTVGVVNIKMYTRGGAEYLEMYSDDETSTDDLWAWESIYELVGRSLKSGKLWDFSSPSDWKMIENRRVQIAQIFSRKMMHYHA